MMLSNKPVIFPARLCGSEPTFHHRRGNGFTLIELLVVVAIIGVLGGLLIPVFTTVQKKTDQTNCASNLKQIVVATNLSAQDHNNYYPNMRGYNWEGQSSDTAAPPVMWIADALAPYVAGTVNQDPTKLLRCPSAQKNPQETWLEATLYAHYRYNTNAQYVKPPLVGFSNAMLFFDTTYHDWTADQVAHYPGSGAIVNVGYVDGHVAPLPFKTTQTPAPYPTFLMLNPSDSTTDDFFTLGWVK